MVLALVKLHVNDPITRSLEGYVDRRVETEGVVFDTKIGGRKHYVLALIDPYRLPKTESRNWINFFDWSTFRQQLADEMSILQLSDIPQNRVNLSSVLYEQDRWTPSDVRAMVMGRVPGLHHRIVGHSVKWDDARRVKLPTYLDPDQIEKAYIRQRSIVAELPANGDALNYIQELETKHKEYRKRALPIGSAQSVYDIERAKKISAWVFSACRTCEQNAKFFAWLAQYYQNTLLNRLRKLQIEDFSALVLDPVPGFSSSADGALAVLHLYGNSATGLALFITPQTVPVLRSLFAGNPRIEAALTQLSCPSLNAGLGPCPCDRSNLPITLVQKDFARLFQVPTSDVVRPFLPCTNFNSANPDLTTQVVGASDILAVESTGYASDGTQVDVYSVDTLGYQGGLGVDDRFRVFSVTQQQQPLRFSTESVFEQNGFGVVGGSVGGFPLPAL